MNKRRRIKILMVVAALILVSVVLCSGLRILESTVLHKEPEHNEAVTSKTIYKDNIAYFPRQDITVFLITVTNESDRAEGALSGNGTGETELAVIAVFDETQKCYHILALNPDTVAEIPATVSEGKTAVRLAAVNAVISGREEGCEKTKQAVSELLGGVYIDYYLSMSLDMMAVLTDAVGGVTVTIEDDFADVDPALEKGEMTLNGQQVLTFLRTRGGAGAQLNASRMARQESYFRSFAEAMGTENGVSGSIFDIYETISSDIVTDCSMGTLSALAGQFVSYDLREFVTPAGESVPGDTGMEFYPDEEALETLVLDLFYAPK